MLQKIAFAILAAGCVPLAFAQADKPKEDALEEIVVTGSRIAGIAPVGSTVITVGDEQLATTPATNVIDLLRRVPQVSGSGLNESVSGVVGPGVTSSNATRTGAINLRGVGPKATLVLFGGQRLATAGLNGAQTDPAGIPTAALERVEVVADGASAIYGSDAVAGVVNFIPRTRYDGVTARARFTEGDEYSQQQQSLMAGRDWGTGGALFAFQHDFNSRLRGTARDYYRSDLRSEGGIDYRSQQCNPGNILVGTGANQVSYAIPAGGVTPATANQLIPNTRNLCEVYRLGDIQGKQERDALYTSVEQEVTEGVKLWVRGYWSHRRFDANDLQQGSTTSVADITVPSSNAYFVAPPGTAPTSVIVQYFYGNDSALRFTGQTWSYQTTTGLDIDLSGSWKASLTGNWAYNRDVVNATFALPAALTRAINSADRATALNVFGGPNTQAVKDDLFSSFFNSRPISRLFSAQAGVNGELFDLPGGAVRLASGVEYTGTKFRGESNRGTAAAPVITIAKNDRNVKSVYAELYVPLVDKLELSLAGRYDDYSDVGGTTNPKLGVNWSPLDGLTVKGSYGTSFKAPYLSDTISPRSGAALLVTTQFDPFRGRNSRGLQINDGRGGLQPEEATTWTLGLDWKPAMLSGFGASLTYFSLDYDGQITAPVINTVLQNPLFASVLVRDPTPAQIAEAVALGLPVTNGPVGTNVEFIFDGRPTNLSGTKTSGFDFVLGYDRSVSFGELYASLSGTRLTKYDVQVTAIAPAVDVMNTIYYPAKFRANLEAGWSRDAWSGSGTLRYINSYDNNLVTPVQEVDANTTLDLRAGYRFASDNAVLNDLSLSFEVSNVFDKEPPFVNVQGGIDPTAASALGRLFTLTVEKKF